AAELHAARAGRAARLNLDRGALGVHDAEDRIVVGDGERGIAPVELVREPCLDLVVGEPGRGRLAELYRLARGRGADAVLRGVHLPVIARADLVVEVRDHAGEVGVVVGEVDRVD